jgi:hypothetical protein
MSANRKSANSWAQSAIAYPQNSEVCKSVNSNPQISFDSSANHKSTNLVGEPPPKALSDTIASSLQIKDSKATQWLHRTKKKGFKVSQLLHSFEKKGFQLTKSPNCFKKMGFRATQLLHRFKRIIKDLKKGSKGFTVTKCFIGTFFRALSVTVALIDSCFSGSHPPLVESSQGQWQP